MGNYYKKKQEQRRLQIQKYLYRHYNNSTETLSLQYQSFLFFDEDVDEYFATWDVAFTSRNWENIKVLNVYISDNIQLITKSSWPNLKTLKIQNSIVNIKQFFQVQWPTLEEINLSKSKSYDEGFHKIINGNFPNLRSLITFDNGITCYGLKDMHSSRIYLLSLLDLSSNHIGSSGVKYLLKGEFPQLRFLYLRNSKIGNEGMKYLGKGCWRVLESLQVDNNFAVLQGYLPLKEANWKLKTLSVREISAITSLALIYPQMIQKNAQIDQDKQIIIYMLKPKNGYELPTTTTKLNLYLSRYRKDKKNWMQLTQAHPQDGQNVKKSDSSNIGKDHDCYKQGLGEVLTSRFKNDSSLDTNQQCFNIYRSFLKKEEISQQKMDSLDELISERKKQRKTDSSVLSKKSDFNFENETLPCQSIKQIRRKYRKSKLNRQNRISKDRRVRWQTCEINNASNKYGQNIFSQKESSTENQKGTQMVIKDIHKQLFQMKYQLSRNEKKIQQLSRIFAFQKIPSGQEAINRANLKFAKLGSEIGYVPKPKIQYITSEYRDPRFLIWQPLHYR